MPFHDRNEPGRVPKSKPAVPRASGPPRPPTRPPKPPAPKSTFIDTGPATGKKQRGRGSKESSLTPGVALVYALVIAAAGVFLGGIGIFAMNWNAVRGWIDAPRPPRRPNPSQISPGTGDAPPVTNDAPTPRNQQPAGAPAPPPGFAGIAKAAAERAKYFADEVREKDNALNPPLADAKKFCEQLERLAKDAEEAVAAGKSPQPVVEPFEDVKAEFERAVEQAVAITKDARSAADAAMTAAKQAADQAERARQEFNAAKSTLDSRRRAEPPGSPELPPLQDAYDAAMKVFQDAEKAEENASKLAKDARECASRLGASGESLTNFQSRIDKAARQIETSLVIVR